MGYDINKVKYITKDEFIKNRLDFISKVFDDFCKDQPKAEMMESARLYYYDVGNNKKKINTGTLSPNWVNVKIVMYDNELYFMAENGELFKYGDFEK